MSRGPRFTCAPGNEALAAELAEFVDGSWELAPGVYDVMVMPNGGAVPAELPKDASEAALAWWHRSVSIALAPTRRAARQHS
jgi:hypothetical protein